MKFKSQRLYLHAIISLFMKVNEIQFCSKMSKISKFAHNYYFGKIKRCNLYIYNLFVVWRILFNKKNLQLLIIHVNKIANILLLFIKIFFEYNTNNFIQKSINKCIHLIYSLVLYNIYVYIFKYVLFAPSNES